MSPLTLRAFSIMMLFMGLALPLTAKPVLAQDSLLPKLFADDEAEQEEAEQAASEESSGPKLDLNAPGVADCPDAPDDAYVFIPEPFYNWAKLECRAEGHFITAADGYDWRSMEGELFEVTAKNNDDLVAVANQLPYFTTMGVAQLDTSQALHAGELIDALLGQLTISTRPDINKGDFDEYWRLYALTKGQVQIDLYFFLINGLPQYFVFCEKACSGGRKPQIVRVIASSDILNQNRLSQ